MKLHELNIAKFDLVEEFDLAWDNSINEGMFDSIKDSFRKVANTFTQVYNKSNTKSGLNDVVLRAMYMEELTKLRDALSKAPSPVSNKLTPMLLKNGIKINGGIDLSRKNLNRIMIIKIIRVILFAMKQMKDNGIQWLLSAVVSGGILTIISLIMDADDYKDIGKEFIKSSKQIKTLIDKSNEQ